MTKPRLASIVLVRSVVCVGGSLIVVGAALEWGTKVRGVDHAAGWVLLACGLAVLSMSGVFAATEYAIPAAVGTAVLGGAVLWSILALRGVVPDHDGIGDKVAGVGMILVATVALGGVLGYRSPR